MGGHCQRTIPSRPICAPRAPFGYCLCIFANQTTIMFFESVSNNESKGWGNSHSLRYQVLCTHFLVMKIMTNGHEIQLISWMVSRCTRHQRLRIISVQRLTKAASACGPARGRTRLFMQLIQSVMLLCPCRPVLARLVDPKMARNFHDGLGSLPPSNDAETLGRRRRTRCEPPFHHQNPQASRMPP